MTHNRMLLPFKKVPLKIGLHFCCSQVDELRQKLEQKNKLIEKKTQEALLVGPQTFVIPHFLLISHFQSTQEKNRVSSDMNELRDHLDIKDRKISVLQRKVREVQFCLTSVSFQLDLGSCSVKGLVKQQTYLFNDPSIDSGMQTFCLFKLFP